jgi:hypothetical protein
MFEGFSISGGMVGSDVVIGWIDANNQPILTDRRVLAKGPVPQLDKSQDYTLTHWEKTQDGFLIFEFNRKFVTGDIDGDIDIVVGANKVIYALSNTLPTDANTIPYHDERDTTQISFYGPPYTPPNLNGTQTADLVVNNIVVPSDSTTYFCKRVEFPQIDAHIVRYEAVIDNVQKVHHMLMYNCPADFVPSVDSGNCDTMSDFRRCQEVSYAWGRGGLPLDLPAEAGNLIGPKVARYAYLEIHYDNPKQESNTKDNSGVRIYYTTQKRKYDAGVLYIGKEMGNIEIPPHEKAYDISGECHSSCTAALPKEGIKIYGALLHSHLLGRSLRTEVYRNGQRQPDLGNLQYYDFNFQTVLPMEPHYTLLPGDSTITHCIYDSTERTTVTRGGEATTNEMCYNFLFYYPRVQAHACVETLPGISCDTTAAPWIAVASVGLIVIVGVAIGVGVFFYRRRKARLTKAKEVDVEYEMMINQTEDEQ